jgi:hypothetical protein
VEHVARSGDQNNNNTSNACSVVESFLTRLVEVEVMLEKTSCLLQAFFRVKRTIVRMLDNTSA